MNEIEKKKFGMYRDVLSLLTKHTEVCVKLEAVAFLIAKLRKTMDEIEQADRNVTTQEALDLTIEGRAGKESLTADLRCIAQSLFNYSRQSAILELKDSAKYTQSYFLHLPDAEFLSKAESLRLLSLKYIVELRHMGITPNIIHGLGLKIEYFRRALEKKVLASKAGSGRTQLSGLFLIADQVLENTDKLIGSMPDEFEEFYEEYICARDFENQERRKALLDLEEDEGYN